MDVESGEGNREAIETGRQLGRKHWEARYLVVRRRVLSHCLLKGNG